MEFLCMHIREAYHVEVPEINLEEMNDIQFSFFENICLILGIKERVGYGDNPRKVWTRIYDVLIETLPPYYVPGSQFEYCNYGYDILSQLITLIANTSFEAFAFEKLFQPLGMYNTFWKVPESMYNNVVKRYKLAMAANWLNSDDFMKRTTGYDGLKSTVPDMMAFLEMIRNKGRYNNLQVFSEKGISLFTTNHNRHLPKGSGRTVGFHIHDEEQDGLGAKRSQEAIDHGGMGGSNYDGFLIRNKYCLLCC